GGLDSDKTTRVDWVSGCALFADRKSWDRLEGFDERYFLYVEDVDLGRKAREASIPVTYFPKVDVVHAIRGSALKRPAFSDLQHHIGMFRYSLKWSGPMGKLAAPFIALAIVARYLSRRILA